MNQVKCTNCGAAIFSSAVAAESQATVTVNCQYCGSQFETRNPNYSPHTTAPVNIYKTEIKYTYTEPAPPESAWKAASDLQHKITKVLGYIMGGIGALFALVMWIVAFLPDTDMPVGVPVIFSLLVFGIFMLARASSRELKRRHGKL
ncbi:hypothetical protein CLV59_103152 [Chitinophaga dinghuensis]|uniref:Zinc ribbon domain-containing protein n=1 Tax=Chitinophaga dinghuensis TaxID=1539050 RepID=A0A327W328_9BACT|nr:hypothetical protein [Chitinophaga dinghuensis]RAJ83192.1 hypothetical protein CLV59_103152 [Chitinophaga dinghuensis]